MKQETVNVVVGKIGIKEWLNGENHQYHSIFQKLLNDPKTHPLKMIANSDEVYIINYNTKDSIESEENNLFESRVFLTDLINTMDFTIFTNYSQLIGCDIQVIEEYPEEVQKVITDYVFGVKGDLVDTEEEVQKYYEYYELMNQIDKFRNRGITSNKIKEKRFFELLESITSEAESDRLTNISEIYEEHDNPENKSPKEIINNSKETIIIDSEGDIKNQLQVKVVRYLGQEVFGNFYFSIYYLSQLDETYAEIIHEFGKYIFSTDA